MANTFDKLSVLDSFIEEVNSYLPEIEANLERLAQSPGDMEAIEETYRRAHTIGGSASMMDFPGLAHVAHGMEDILGDVLDGLTSLDAPTLGLLQRSLARMRQLLHGIREGVDEDTLIAEDDADYAQYRALVDSSAPQPYAQDQSNGQLKADSLSVDMPDATSISSSAMPSLDEVLASFRTPSVSAGEEVAWPEDPASVSSSADDADQTIQLEIPPLPEPASSSALEMLAAAARPPAAQSDPLATPALPSSPANEVTGQQHAAQPELAGDEQLPAQYSAESETPETSFAHVYSAMQEETLSLEAQASSLKEILNRLRMAMSVIETQRSEFKGFLDGSKDALDRMEDWAGQAMGLNLRNSPEQVRRYLPLSVMWVSNTRLKKVLDLLTQITGGVEMTDEQLHSALEQLSASLEACKDVFQQLLLQANTPSHVLKQEPGWTAWEMQFPLEDEAVRERVTFERRGDPAALRAEIEAKIREELRYEYETRPLTLAARSELERQIRSEVRQEFEAKRQLQESVSGAENTESLQEIAAQLRSEIEIQVRQEFLEMITASGGILNSSLPQTLMPPALSAPRTSNFVDQAQQATSLASFGSPAIETQHKPVTQPAQSPITPSPPAATKPLFPEMPSQSIAQQPPLPVLAFTGDFGEEAAEIFRLEAEEHLQTISMHVAALEKSPTNLDLIQGIRRATHTLKGAASMMGFRSIADLSHISEDLLDSVMEGTTTISPAVLSLVLDTAETLDQLITGRGTDPADDEAKVQSLRARYVELLGEQSTTLDADEDMDVDDVGDESIMGTSSVAGVVAGAQAAETNAQRAARGDLSVRVRLQKLDELVNLFGELLVNRSILEERIQRLIRLVADVDVSSTRLRDVGQKLESRFEAATLPSGHSVQVMPGEGDRSMRYPLSNNGNKNRQEPSHLAEFDELELDRYTEFHQLARGLSEGISDMTTLSTEMDAIIRECEGVFGRESRLSTTFQDRLMKARLVPLSTMTPRLYRAARAVALKQHKEFEFLLEGEDTEVDRTVNEEIAGPLLHLMRNAVNHAIETPEVRVQKGKPPAGQIKLTAAYEGNQVVITVRDDGVGIDPDRVRNAAIARGWVRPDQILNDNDVIDLIFRPGFSTAEVLSEESGRGVGLDVVRDSVSRLRGTLEVESMPGQGTAFTMKFPTSLAIQNAMMVQVSGQLFAIPTVMVEAIGRLDNFKRSTLAGHTAVVVQNDLYPLHLLSQLLSLSVNEPDEKAPLLLINTAGHRVALVVDEIRGRLDVVMKNLGPHLRHVHSVAGGTVMGNGRVVLILELGELLSTRAKLKGSATGVTAAPMRRDTTGPALQTPARSAVAIPTGQQNVPEPPLPTPPAAPSEHGKYVLVVDDSPSVRRVVSNMLKQHGWEVQMARDGIEALDMISHETPAAVLLDIEMPRMDGYELIATVRAQEQYRTLPLVVLTSRAAAKHQQRATQLGASSYVVKPYQDEELINTLNTLVYGAAAR